MAYSPESPLQAETTPSEPDDDFHQEFKDGVAMGYWDRDGNVLEPDEPDWSEL